MATISCLVTDTTIRAFARERGYVDAAVVSITLPEYPGAHDAGSWYVLSVKRNSGDDWEVLGRRRTKAELIAVLK